MSDPARSVVFIVDDDASVRKGLGRLMRSAGYHAESFDSAEAFLAHPPADLSACLILDFKMPGLDGPALQELLEATGSLLPIVFLSGHADVPTSVRAMKNGAQDFLQKPFEDHILLQAVAAALERSSRTRAQSGEIAGIRSRLELLTPREREVLEQVITGALNKQIAATLGIAEKTVKIHRAQVMRKMRAGSVAELVRLAARAGIEPAAR
jgi:FixJ family two-component response regulator